MTDICIYCGEPILELSYLDGVPLHEACMDAWMVQEKVSGIITEAIPVTEELKFIKKEERFTRDLLVGSFFKNLATTIFYNAGYEVFPFGYESFLAGLKRPLYNLKLQHDSAAERIRSTPDLVVLDRENKEIYIIEVKFRSRLWDNREADIFVSSYQKYWSESILLLICPRGKNFYAQYVKYLKREYSRFPVADDFLPLENIFPRISWEKPVRKSFYTRLIKNVAKNLVYE